jgi:glycosyltransferase involved in cell wall biosynthesis
LDKLVSVIVPCFNQSAYLAETIQSVLDQSYQHWECLIVNDGSTDNSLAIANNLASTDRRISVINQINAGLSNARNTGIDKANGEFILPLDADDRISINYISSCINHFKVDSSLSLVYGNGVKFGCINENWNLPQYSYHNLLFGNMIYCTAMFKKEDWQKAGGYDEGMKYGYEDWEFWINILDSSSKVIREASITFFYRIRENSMFSKMSIDEIALMRQYVYKKHANKYNPYFVDPIYIYKNRNDIKSEYDRLFDNPIVYFKKYLKKIFS